MSPDKPNPGKLERGATVSSYEILGRLGDGGFGYIFKVRRDGKVYALKIARHRLADLPAEDRGPTEERLHREVAALMTLHHPNIVRIHSFDRWPDIEDGYPYLVMDYVEGSCIYEWRAEAKPSLAQICTVFEKIASAVGHMHRLGICHRDLKSANVIVRPDGEPVIVDFGLARSQVAYGVTQASSIGTLTHYPPEYAAYFDSGAYCRQPFEWRPTTDIYTLGYVLYVTLAGETPLTVVDENGPLSEPQVLDKIKNEVPDPPSVVNPAIPASLDEIVLRLLEKDPAKRAQSADELAEMLRRVRGEAGRAWEVPLEDVEDGIMGVTHEEKARPPDASAAAGAEGVPMLPAEAVIEIPPPAGAERPSPGAAKAAPAGGKFQEPSRVQQPPFADEAAAPARTASRKPSGGLPSEVRRMAAQVSPRATRPALLSLLVGGGLVALTVGVILFLGARAPAPAREPKVLLSASMEPRRVQSPAENPKPTEDPAPGGVERGPGVLPGVDAGSKVSSPQPLEVPAKQVRRPAKRRRVAAKPAPERAPIAIAGPISESPVLLQSVRLGAEKPPVSPTPKPLGVPLGAHIRAKLVTNLDTRTIGSGPVEAELRVPFVVRGEVVLPSHTRVYGTASEGSGRFNVRFTQLRLPDDSVVAMEGIAFSRDDAKPGLAADRRIEGPPPKSEGLGTKIAKGTGNILLDTITGGTAQDIARSAGQTTLSHEAAGPTSSSTVLLLDAGVDFSIFVAHQF